MIRTIYGALYIVFLVLATVPRLLKLKKMAPTLAPEEKDRLVHKTPDWFGKGMLRVSGSKIEVKGLGNIPQDRAVLVVSNHQSNFDIPLLMGYLNKPIGFISKAEVKKLPIVRTWMEMMNCVFMDRSNRRQSLQAIKDGITLLKQGHSLVIFPEGTRGKNGEIGEFKTGSFHLAVKSGVPILPVTISGTHNIFESNGNRIKSAEVTLTVSEPIYEEQYKDMDIKELAQHVQDVVASKIA
ncbi:lysophospholipid acyltransferase family protein [Microbacteriaceae bacterium 4G12]